MRRKIFYFALICLISMLFPLFLSFLAYEHTCELMETNTSERNRNVLELCRENVDGYYREMDLLFRQAGDLISASQLTFAPESNLNNQFYMKQLQTELNRCMGNIRYVDSYSLYFRQIDTVITKDACYKNSESYFNLVIQAKVNPEFTYEKWKAFVDAQYNFLTVQPNINGLEGTEADSLLWYCSIPIELIVASKGIFVVNTRMQAMNAMMAPLEAEQSGYAVYDEDGHMLFEKSFLRNLPDDFLFDPLSHGTESFHVAEGSPQIINCVLSTQTGWRFFSMPDVGLVQEELEHYQNLSLSLACAVGIFSLICLVFAVLHFLRPVIRIEDNNRMLQDKVKTQNQFIEQTFWNRILNGGAITQSQLEKLILETEVHFTAPAFCAVCIRIRNEVPPAGFDFVSNTSHILWERGGLSCAIHQIIPNQYMLCLMLGDSNWADTIHIAVEQLMDFFDSLKLNYTIGVGEPCDSLTMFHRSYYQSELALDYSNAGETAIYYSDITAVFPTAHWSDWTNLVYQMVQEGNDHALEKQMDEIRTSFSATDGGRLEQMRILYELCNVVMRINAQLPPDKQRSVDIASNMAAVSTTRDTLRELENLQSQILKLCVEMKNARINRRRRSAEQLLKYVQENYNDPNLSLKSIGALFEMNEIYVSSCFKQTTGINFLEYLQKIRLTKALELLQTTNLTIAETAVKVGYANDQTFRRAFKRAYGVSPTSYMESVISSQEEQKKDNSKEEKEHL